jgi:hypothetical protein
MIVAPPTRGERVAVGPIPDKVKDTRHGAVATRSADRPAVREIGA